MRLACRRLFRRKGTDAQQIDDDEPPLQYSAHNQRETRPWTGTLYLYSRRRSHIFIVRVDT
jgi:hypothetical protein